MSKPSTIDLILRQIDIKVKAMLDTAQLKMLFKIQKPLGPNATLVRSV